MSRRSCRVLIKEYALREGVWMTLPRLERRLFDLTLHPTVERWWGRVQWHLALDLLRKVVQRLRLAWLFLKSKYFRRCYVAAQALIEGSLRSLKNVEGRMSRRFMDRYVKCLKETMLDPDLIMYVGTRILYEVPGQGLRAGSGR
ncbi:MAG: hypothetical protein QXI59_06445 [Candidatus Bathyarchaeia archaeon]